MTDTQRVLADVLLENCKPTSRDNVEMHSRFKRYYVRNKDTIYKNTDEDKNTLLQELYSKIDHANSLDTVINSTGRNLIYFTVFLNEEYVDLIEIALQSILDYTSEITFDILFITDEEYKEKILQKPVINKFNYHFHLVPTPISGTRASIQKLAVYDYPDINQYEKILFLDCDVVCIKNINEIFNLITSTEKLYTGTCKIMTAHALSTPTHGIMFYTERDIEILVQNFSKFKPFNAGQFVFYNTTRMREHFNNVNWLVKNWPGYLFFEQGAMNYYFVINNISEILTAQNNKSVFTVTYIPSPEREKKLNGGSSKQSVIVTGATNTACLTSVEMLFKMENIETLVISPEKETCIVHFAGVPLNGTKKLEVIKMFLNARKS